MEGLIPSGKPSAFAENITPEMQDTISMLSESGQLENLLKVSESGQYGEGLFKRLLGEGSPMQQGIDTGLEEGQTNLLQRLILSLAR